LPAVEIARIAEKLGVAGIALASVDFEQSQLALEELRQLDAALAPGVPVWLGGANARYLAEELASPRIQAVGDVQALTRGVPAHRMRG
jgi:MerR family transcriptional regulator, light-induced transcriptional regulator